MSFLSLRLTIFPEAKPRGTLPEVKGKQKLLFPHGPSHYVFFVKPPNSKIGKTVKNVFA